MWVAGEWIWVVCWVATRFSVNGLMGANTSVQTLVAKDCPGKYRDISVSDSDSESQLHSPW